MNNLDFSTAVESIFKVLSTANRYFTQMAPWTLKEVTDEPQKRRILSLIFETLRICSILLSPIMPTSMNKLLDIQSVPLEKRNLSDATLYSLKRESDLLLPKVIEPLFPKRSSS